MSSNSGSRSGSRSGSNGWDLSLFTSTLDEISPSSFGRRFILKCNSRYTMLPTGYILAPLSQLDTPYESLALFDVGFMFPAELKYYQGELCIVSTNTESFNYTIEPGEAICGILCS